MGWRLFVAEQKNICIVSHKYKTTQKKFKNIFSTLIYNVLKLIVTRSKVLKS